jgi:23S rRNA (cytosine1962-C5)-methyltransferase
MNTIHKITLKPGKEKAIKNKHHWIFSGAIASLPKGGKGEILPVYSNKGELLGQAYYNPKVAITGRMVCFNDTDPEEAIIHSLNQAFTLRKQLFDDKVTNTYRLINGEGDLLPGLVIDRYNQTLVIQILTLGMEKLRPLILKHLIQTFNPHSIYEKSNQGSRKEEGLPLIEHFIHGKEHDEVEVLENGLKFIVSIREGQKTGFFLDQREMRQKVKELSRGKKVLNCFSYTGGFSIYALAGGAASAVSVDISGKAIDTSAKNAKLNGFAEVKHQTIEADVFTYLREQELPYDIVILDPPAFAKGKKDVIPACRGYKDINRIAIKKMKPGSILITCSCSAYIDTPLFQQVVFQAAAEAGRQVQIIGRHILAADHPINIFHPETEYLKSLILFVS